MRKVVLVVAAVVPLCTSCGGSSAPRHGIEVDNATDGPVTFVYLTGPEDPRRPGEVVAGQQVLATYSATSGGLLDVGFNGTCTVAPIVARRADGTEIGRLDASVCSDPLLTWRIVDEGEP